MKQTLHCIQQQQQSLPIESDLTAVKALLSLKLPFECNPLNNVYLLHICNMVAQVQKATHERYFEMTVKFAERLILIASGDTNQGSG